MEPAAALTSAQAGASAPPLITPQEHAPKRVDFAGDTAEQVSEQQTEPGSQRWLSASARNRTDLEDVVVDSRPIRHNKIFRRPRALLYHPVHHNEEKATNVSETPSRTNTRDARDSEERSTDNLPKQLARIDLFVDLVWVGIIANLAGTFGKQAFTDSGVSIGTAVGEFVLLFFPIWRVWDDLRSYTSHYYLE
jgi:hypothetical protein